MSEMTRDEMEARFAARDGRLDAYEARNETKFQELRSDIHYLTSEFRDFKVEVRQELRDVKADNKNTRWTITIAVVASILAAAGALWTAQANLLAAFQAGLAKQAVVNAPAALPLPPTAPAKPERKASLADAR